MAFKEYRLTNDWPYHVSCGGIVYRSKGDEREIMLLVRHDGNFDIPKGTLNFGETLEACALREVQEESGQITAITGYLGSALREGVDGKTGSKISKAVHYFALKWISDTGEHDHEYSHIEWCSVKEAKARLQTSNAEIIERLEKFVRLKKAKL